MEIEPNPLLRSQLPREKQIPVLVTITMAGGCLVPLLDWVAGPDRAPFFVFWYAVINLLTGTFLALHDEGAEGKPLKVGARGYLTILVAILQFYLPIPYFGTLKPTSSFFRYFAVSYVLSYLHPMLEQIRGRMTDNQSYLYLEITSIKLYAWFAPVIVYHLLWLAFQFRWIVLMSSLTAMALGIFAPSVLRLFLQLTLGATVMVLGFVFPIHDRFLWVYESFIYGFANWEINIAKLQQDKARKYSARYKYEELVGCKSIRLLKLEKKRLFSPPKCQLIHYQLDEAPPYEALSYTWEGQRPEFPLQVDGRHVLITRNVQNFLYRNRSFFRPRIFWIDSICINQNDDNEKSNQLPLMTAIYRQATRVLVWLGPPTSARQARDLRKAITREVNPHVTSILDVEDVEAAFDTLRNCLKHSWFERGWVIQEVAVAEKVHILFNGTCLDWNAIVKASEEVGSDFRKQLQFRHIWFKNRRRARQQLDSNENDTAELLGKPKHCHEIEAVQTIRAATQPNPTLPLASLLWLTRSFKCSDPRDRIFALYGIAADTHAFPYRPNYTDSVEDVYVEVASIFLQTQGWFFALVMAGRGYQSERAQPASGVKSNLPSWVPDFSHDDYWGIRVSEDMGYSLRSHALPVINKEARQLSLKAVQFDSISLLMTESSCRPTSAFSYYIIEILAQEYENPINRWLVNSRAFVRRHCMRSHISQERVDQSLWETVLGDEIPELPDPFAEKGIAGGARSRVARRFADSHHIFEEYPSGKSQPAEDALGFPISEEEDEEFFSYLRTRIDKNVLGKRLCVTSQGFIGLVPPLSAEGDVFVHVEGGYMPILLRKVDHLTNTAQIIGSCFVHGIDDEYAGERWDQWVIV